MSETYGRRINTLDDISALIDSEGPDAVGNILRQEAANGNAFCQKFLSQAHIFATEVHDAKPNDAQFETHTKLAAESGDQESQFNLGQFYIKKVDPDKKFLDEDDIEHIKRAQYWHGKAASKGFEPSVKMVKTLSVFRFE